MTFHQVFTLVPKADPPKGSFDEAKGSLRALVGLKDGSATEQNSIHKIATI